MLEPSYHRRLVARVDEASSRSQRYRCVHRFDSFLTVKCSDLSEPTSDNVPITLLIGLSSFTTGCMSALLYATLELNDTTRAVNGDGCGCAWPRMRH